MISNPNANRNNSNPNPIPNPNLNPNHRQNIVFYTQTKIDREYRMYQRCTRRFHLLDKTRFMKYTLRYILK